MAYGLSPGLEKDAAFAPLRAKEKNPARERKKGSDAAGQRELEMGRAKGSVSGGFWFFFGGGPRFCWGCIHMCVFRDIYIYIYIYIYFRTSGYINLFPAVKLVAGNEHSFEPCRGGSTCPTSPMIVFGHFAWARTVQLA